MLISFSEKSAPRKTLFECNWETLDIKPEDSIMYKGVMFRVLARTYDFDLHAWYVVIQDHKSWRKEIFNVKNLT